MDPSKSRHSRRLNMESEHGEGPLSSGKALLHIIEFMWLTYLSVSDIEITPSGH